jgi:hypothetical protein
MAIWYRYVSAAAAGAARLGSAHLFDVLGDRSDRGG